MKKQRNEHGQFLKGHEPIDPRKNGLLRGEGKKSKVARLEKQVKNLLAHAQEVSVRSWREGFVYGAFFTTIACMILLAMLH